MDKGQLVLFDGFSQYPELTPGDVYCVDEVNGDHIRLWGFEGSYDRPLFSCYDPRFCFEHYDKSRGDFEIPGLENTRLRLRRINWMKEGRVQDIDISDIHYKNMDNEDNMRCPCCGGSRVVSSNMKEPGIVVDGTETISGRRYRSMDGSHRLQKMLYYGYKTAPVYVFHIDEIRNYYEPMEGVWLK